jgi:hypothetical protein
MEAIAPAGFSWTAVARAQKELKGSGAIRFGHTDPTKGATGLDAILLMGLELFGRPSLSLVDVRNPRFAAFVDGLESGLSQMLSTNGALALASRVPAVRQEAAPSRKVLSSQDR